LCRTIKYSSKFPFNLRLDPDLHKRLVVNALNEGETLNAFVKDVLEKYRGKIVEQFFPARGDGKLKLGEARKAIRDYRKATGNLPGTVELLMTYVENGTRFTHEYGDIDERFYSSVESVLDELATLLRGKARGIYPQFRDRLARVEQMSDGIGWGFHDFVGDVVWQLEEELGGR
jgi:predicted DNA-binding protein